jgi:hypothetical protein
VKEVTIPALSSKFKGLKCESAQPIATIHALQHPTISGMPAWVTLYNNKKLQNYHVLEFESE